MGLKIVACSIKNYDQVGPVSVDGRVHSLSEVTDTLTCITPAAKAVRVNSASINQICILNHKDLLNHEAHEEQEDFRV
ncbi:MAG: hypothetical protein AB1847_22890 [bacterium]